MTSRSPAQDALEVLYSNASRAEKERANGFLESFQKSVIFTPKNVDVLMLMRMCQRQTRGRQSWEYSTKVQQQTFT